MNVAKEMAGLAAKLAASAASAQAALSAAALEDCNKFCKVDSGETRESSYRASDMVLGRLVWNTRYARHAYYLNEAKTNKNARASRLWAHKAAALYADKWRRLAKSTFAYNMLRLKGR